MSLGLELTIVLVVVVALAVGAATRGLARSTGTPYTIAVLLVGLVAGLLLDGPHLGTPASPLIDFAASISPALILYVFLPALIFESAFALDAYGFRKNLGPILVLAVLGLATSTVATAFLMRWLTGGSWEMTLSAALVFGALISATDPVAVVAILREQGAPRRLGILIEGESLMNDGTAIVLFNVLLGLLVVGSGQIDPGVAALDFARVVVGGVGVGLLIAIGGSLWLSRTFNDPLVEIVLTLVMAYAAMAIAEGLLHVSGVMALVTTGLWMSSVGRPRISPEVSHFLHQFWELLAYVANTLIFVLVGLLVASQLERASWLDLLLVVAVYVVLMGVRFAVTYGLLPLMSRLGEPISAGQAAVMSWGGLRGAVSLALALIACSHPQLPAELRRQLLLLTTGVAFLTIVINGSTVGLLLRGLGLDRSSAGEQLAQAGTRARALHGVRQRLGELSQELKSVDWSEVMRDLGHRHSDAEQRVAAIRTGLEGLGDAERAAGFQRQALRVEREQYWHLHAQGILGPRALRVLTRELDVQRGRIERGDTRLPQARIRRADDLLSRIARRLRALRLDVGTLAFEHLALRYDLSWATHQAAVRVLSFVLTLDDADPQVRRQLIEAYRRYRQDGRERLEELRTNLPEMTRAVEARLARRIELNLEREAYQALAREGVIDPPSAGAMLEEVEAQMKRLWLGSTRVALPETADLCRRAPLFEMLDDEELEELAELTRERVFSPGEELFRQGDRGESMFVIARGAVHVEREREGEHELVVLGGGDILGEMALLSGEPRTATVRAVTTVTVGEIRRDAFEQLMRTQPGLREGVWRAFSRRLLTHHLRDRATDPRLSRLSTAEIDRWTRDGRLLHLDSGDRCQLGDSEHVFVATGRCRALDQRLSSPVLWGRLRDVGSIEAETAVTLLLLAAPP